jgi:hypothetical protein
VYEVLPFTYNVFEIALNVFVVGMKVQKKLSRRSSRFLGFEFLKSFTVEKVVPTDVKTKADDVAATHATQ